MRIQSLCVYQKPFFKIPKSLMHRCANSHTGFINCYRKKTDCEISKLSIPNEGEKITLHLNWTSFGLRAIHCPHCSNSNKKYEKKKFSPPL